MQTAEAALTAIQRLGQKGLPLERVYRLLFNPELYMTAYGRLARNAGALTPGSTPETVDGMSRVKVEAIIEELRHEQFRWTPVRRTYIEKKNSTKKRPLGLPTWTDKLVQEVIRLILDTYYELQFSPHSHGFRAGRGCHTALSEVYYNWRGTTWFIEGDISGCFDSLNHDVLIELLSERIKDGRFLRLICGLLDAGYLEEWKHHATLSGAPQGSVVSPLLANVYLNELDRFVERTLVPAYNRGDRRKDNRAYQALHTRIRYWEKRSGWDRVKALREEYRRTPSKDPDDPAYRRLKYVRYADDFLLGFCGPKAEAEEVKQQLTAFLRERLKLQLSEQKTLITHARTGAARFLGYEVTILDADDQRDAKGNRNINGQVGLRVPADVIRDKGIPYKRGGKPMHRPELTFNDAYSIVAQYQAEYRGVVEYYRMAFNLHRMAALKRTMEISLSKTLASKLRCSCNAVWCRYGAVAEIHGKRYRVLEISVPREGKAALVAKWGGISLKFRTKGVTLDDAPSRAWNRRSEIVERLLAGTCERCGSQEDVQVHHVRKLADLAKPGRRTAPEWAQLMSARRRKTLVVCRKCHEGIHAGVGSGKAEGHRRAV